MKILIVDDDIFNQEVLKLRLGELGFESVVANNGQEAVELIKNASEFEMIFMDLNMPIMEGDEASKEIRKIEAQNSLKRVPIIGASASLDKKDRERLLECGMDDLITKPIVQKELEEKLNKFLFKQNSFKYDIEKASKTLMMPKEVLSKFIEKFTLTLHDELAGMVDAIDKKNYKALRDIAHKLKGRSGNLQITPIYELFTIIENSAKEEKDDDYIALIDQICQINSELKKF
ncbi:response regulator [bacterium]|nr:response regulator [bacterium]MBU1989890.1 response regulator [bacterium]